MALQEVPNASECSTNRPFKCQIPSFENQRPVTSTESELFRPSLNKKSWNDLLCKGENTISLAIEIKTKKSEPVYNENFTRNCDANAVETWNIARIGNFNLKKGDYIFTATNFKKIPIQENQKTQLILIGTKSAGFP